MKIISKFTDYYDVALGLGIDPNLTYVRKTEELELKTPYHQRIRHDRYIHKGEVIEYFVGLLSFCGVIYPYYKFTRSWIDRDLGGLQVRKYEDYYAWTKEQYVEYLTKFPQDPNRYSKWWSGNMLPEKSAGMWGGNYHNHFESVGQSDHSLHIDCKTPIILFDSRTQSMSGKRFIPPKYTCILNPNLKQIQFSKRLEALKAYQEISMYVGGVLPRSGREMVEISDVDKRDKHGFDNSSFKTSSPGKKANRRSK